MAKFTRNTVPSKRPKNTSGLAVIIPAAGMGYRAKSLGPKCLFTVDNITILNRQIELFNDCLKPNEIIVVGGFEINDVEKAVEGKAKLVYNHIYEETNVTYSVYLGLMNTLYQNIIISYGDLYFSESSIRGISSLDMITIVGTSNMPNKKIGFTNQGPYVSGFSFSSPQKWGQVSFVPHSAYQIFRKAVKYSAQKKYLLHEVLNGLINKGQNIVATNLNSDIMDIEYIESDNK